VSVAVIGNGVRISRGLGGSGGRQYLTVSVLGCQKGGSGYSGRLNERKDLFNFRCEDLQKCVVSGQ
jgi:hypothetical protein